MRAKFAILLLGLVFIPAQPRTAWSQLPSFATSAQGGPPLPGQNVPFPNPGPSEPDEQESKMRRDAAKKANQQRQEQLKRDTDRLLNLATELKQYVDKTNENVLSVEVVKKADEIEKLAHSVKDKMKGSN